MKIYSYPEREQWAEIIARPHLDVSQLHTTVSSVLDDVRTNGDAAIIRYEEKFDHVSLQSLRVSQEEMEEANRLISQELKDALIFL